MWIAIRRRIPEFKRLLIDHCQFREQRSPIGALLRSIAADTFLTIQIFANNFTINSRSWRRTAIGRIGSGCSANIELFDIKYLCWLCHAIFEECWRTLDPPVSTFPLLPYAVARATSLSLFLYLPPSFRRPSFPCIDEFS